MANLVVWRRDVAVSVGFFSRFVSVNIKKCAKSD